MMVENFYSLKKTAKMLDVSIRTLRRIIENENIEVYQVGNRLRLSEVQIKSMIKKWRPTRLIVEEILRK